MIDKEELMQKVQAYKARQAVKDDKIARIRKAVADMGLVWTLTDLTKFFNTIKEIMAE